MNKEQEKIIIKKIETEQTDERDWSQERLEKKDMTLSNLHNDW